MKIKPVETRKKYRIDAFSIPELHIFAGKGICIENPKAYLIKISNVYFVKNNISGNVRYVQNFYIEINVTRNNLNVSILLIAMEFFYK